MLTSRHCAPAADFSRRFAARKTLYQWALPRRAAAEGVHGDGVSVWKSSREPAAARIVRIARHEGGRATIVQIP
jgi:hypothetical protein